MFLDVPDAAVNFPAVGFELGFTRTACADAAAQLRHLNSAPAQPRQHIFELRQFHLQLAFTGAGVLGENVEDELGAIDDPRVDDFLDIALLGCGEVVIEQKKIGRDRGGGARNLFQFALADQRGRIGLVAVLQKFAGDLRSRAGCERTQFVERFFRAELGNLGGFRCSGQTAGAVSRGLRAAGQRTFPGLGGRPRTRAHVVVDPDQKSAFGRAATGSSRNQGTSCAPCLV